MTYKGYFIDVKTYPLRDGPEWTAHFTIERDMPDRVEFVKKIETGERFGSELAAQQFGELEAKKFVDGLEFKPL
jgi:hypothetical protein